MRFYKQLDALNNKKAKNKLIERLLVEMFQTIRRNWRCALRTIRLVKENMSSNVSNKFEALRRTKKKCIRLRKQSHDFEAIMIDQALQAIKAETLSLFLAKRLPNIKEKVDKSTE